MIGNELSHNQEDGRAEIDAFGSMLADLLSGDSVEMNRRIGEALGCPSERVLEMLLQLKLVPTLRYPSPVVIQNATDVTVNQLVEAGVLPDGASIFMELTKKKVTKGKSVEAKVGQSGEIKLIHIQDDRDGGTEKGRKYQSLRLAGNDAWEAITGEKKKCDAWYYWEYREAGKRLEQLQIDYCLKKAGIGERVAPAPSRSSGKKKAKTPVTTGELQAFACTVIGLLDAINHILVKGITTDDLDEYELTAVTGKANFVVQMLANLGFDAQIPREAKPLAVKPDSVTFGDLVAEGMIKIGDSLFHYFHRGPVKGKTAYATVVDGGEIEFGDPPHRYPDPGAAAAAAYREFTGETAQGGERYWWRWWHYTDENGRRRRLSRLRNMYVRLKSGISTDADVESARGPSDADVPSAGELDVPNFRRLDPARLETIGRKGEEVVCKHLERKYSAGEGYQVDWLNKKDEAFEKYDIKVLRNGDLHRYVEVKATVGGTEYARAFISDRELQFRKLHAECHDLYLVVFDGDLDDAKPAIRELRDEDFTPEPVMYRLTFR